jgi:hypothetical protein
MGEAYVPFAQAVCALNDSLRSLCHSQCHIRYQSRKYFMSSTDWAPVMSQGGIFDSDATGSGFSSANKIYVKCVPPAAQAQRIPR